jgi:hypothetical protein
MRAERSSAARHPDPGGRPYSTLATVRKHIRPRGPTVDHIGEIVAGAIAADVLSIRSEHLLMEEMDYNLLFSWFVSLNADDEVWDPTVFTKNRDWLLEADVAKKFLYPMRT